MTVKQILRVKDAVAYILSKYPETRDCDRLLYLKYLDEFHRLNYILRATTDPYLALKDLLTDPAVSGPESIRRVRQKLQEQGKYVGTNRRERRKQAHLVADWTLGAWR